MAVAARAATPEQGQLDASPTLFAVMAAINAAGYDADASSPHNNPLRDVIRKELAGKNISCLQALRDFYRQHRQGDAVANMIPVTSQSFHFILACPAASWLASNVLRPAKLR